MIGLQEHRAQPKSGVCAADITTKDQYHVASRVTVGMCDKAMSQDEYLVPHEDPWPIPAGEVLPNSSGYLISCSLGTFCFLPFVRVVFVNIPLPACLQAALFILLYHTAYVKGAEKNTS